MDSTIMEKETVEYTVVLIKTIPLKIDLKNRSLKLPFERI